MPWMYILQCVDSSYYVGSTWNIEKRLWEHNQGMGAKYTARRRPVELVYAAEFESIAEAYSRLTLGLTWLFSLFTVPLGRNLLRGMAARLGLWGEPVLVIGYGEVGRRLVAHLRAHRSLGYYPVAAVDGFAADRRIEGQSRLPVFPAPAGHLDTPGFAALQTAILIPAEVPQPLAAAITRHNCGGFRRLILIPDQLGISSLGVTPVTLNGMIGLKVHDNLLSKFARFQKRLVDFTGASLGLVLLAPLFGLIAILIKLTSRGPVFYLQERVGKDGRLFGMVKFRTMRQHAHQELAALLESNPHLRAEWDQYQKLKSDPRLTPIGDFLRKYSIDELPQLWNVLTGEMSLVGPRPFFPEQREMYGEGFTHYTRVLPGITGLWQVTVRNQSEFTHRADWDAERPQLFPLAGYVYSGEDLLGRPPPRWRLLITEH